jgi:hypothetical protein
LLAKVLAREIARPQRVLSICQRADPRERDIERVFDVSISAVNVVVKCLDMGLAKGDGTFASVKCNPKGLGSIRSSCTRETRDPGNLQDFRLPEGPFIWAYRAVMEESAFTGSTPTKRISTQVFMWCRSIPPMDYSVQTRSARLHAGAESSVPYCGPFSNPKIDSFGPVRSGRESKHLPRR